MTAFGKRKIRGTIKCSKWMGSKTAILKQYQRNTVEMLKRACRASHCIHTHWTKSACSAPLSWGASKDLLRSKRRAGHFLPFGILYLYKGQSSQALLFITLKISHKEYIKAPYFGQIYSRYIHASTELDQWKLTKELQMALYIKQYNIRETIWKYVLSLTKFYFKLLSTFLF